MSQVEDKELNLSREQEVAVELCKDAENKIVCVTGGAGTGKTTILKHVYEEAENPVLCAPTGRAAKRIQEATRHIAYTIHRMLEFPRPSDVVDDPDARFGEPKRNAFNPLPYDDVFVDEASMVNGTLLRQLISAIPRGGKLRMFGDMNQLPPIEGESPFAKAMQKHPTVELTYNYRSGDNLIENCHRILAGRLPVRGPKFEILFTTDVVGAVREIAGHEYAGLEHQVLTPGRKGKVGTVALSSVLRTKFNGNASVDDKLALARPSTKERDLVVFPNDKILWTKNDYVLNIMNGEVGTINWTDPYDGDLEVTWDDRIIHIPPNVRGMYGFYDPRKQIDLAYAMTVHKAQGSEYERVIISLANAQSWLLNRKNFYTAVTRAREKVTVVCTQKALNMALKKYVAR